MHKRPLSLNIFVKIFLFFLGVILFFAFAEVGLRIWLYKKPPLKRVILSSGDRKTMPLILIPNTEGWYRGSLVKLNHKGLRDREYAFKKDNDVFRIYVLGRCPVIGFGVESEETYPKQLEALLNKNNARARGGRRYEVINGGLVGGMRQDEVIKFFKEDGIKYNPDILIFEWEMGRGVTGWWEERKLRHSPLWVDFVFFKIMPLMPKGLYLTRFLYNRFGDYRLQIYWDELIKDNGGEVNYINKKNSLGMVWLNEKAVFKELFDFVQAKKIPVLVVILPWLNYFNKDHPFQYLYSRVIDICDSHKIKTLNLFDELKSMNPSDLWLSDKDRHPNSRAYGIIASAIYKKLLEEGSLR